MRRLAMMALGSSVLGTVLFAYFLSPENGIAIALVGLMMLMHLFGHGGHSHSGHGDAGEK